MNPDLAPKEAQPIKGPGLHAGQLSVVVSFRALPCGGWNLEEFRWAVRNYVLKAAAICDVFADLDVAVRVIGAGGDKVEDEGRWDQLSVTEDVPVARTLRDTDTIDPGERL